MRGPFPVILATLSAPSIASATMCSMCRCGVTCSENVRDACRTPPDAPLRPRCETSVPATPEDAGFPIWQNKLASGRAAYSDYPLA